MKAHLLALLLILALSTSCSKSGRISSDIAAQFDRGDSIDLAQVGPDTWDLFCVLGPYSVKKDAESILGFPWDAEANTSIAMSDGINVLVFVQGRTVVAYTQHPRNKGDFSRLMPDCASRGQAKLVRHKGSAELAWRP